MSKRYPEAIEGFIRTRYGDILPVYRVLDLFYQSDVTLTYLIHIHEPLERSNGYNVRHYIGSTEDLDRRLKEHRRKKKQGGAALLREVNRRGIPWTLSKVWRANRAFEQRIKKNGHFERLCPVCQDVAF